MRGWIVMETIRMRVGRMLDPSCDLEWKRCALDTMLDAQCACCSWATVLGNISADVRLLQFPTCLPMDGLFVHWFRGWGVLSFSERLVCFIWISHLLFWNSMKCIARLMTTSHDMEMQFLLRALCAGNPLLMMTSSNGNIFYSTGPSCGEFSLICAWSCWVNNRETGDLRRHHAHYEVNVLSQTVAITKLWWCVYC